MASRTGEPDISKKPGLPAAARFVDEVRALYASGLEADALWDGIRQAMLPLLADPGLKESVRDWPLTVEGAPRVRNLLFYEDPDYGFVLNATVRKPNLKTNVHDHGDVWTLYGLNEGRDTMYRHARTDHGPRDEGPATLEVVGCHEIGPGDIDAVPPGEIHQEHAGPERSMAFIVRAQRAGTFKQRNFDPETGAVTLNDGPLLIPFELN